MKLPYDDRSMTPAPSESDSQFEWYEYLGPFTILLIYFLLLACCKVSQAICRKCDRSQSSEFSSPENDRYVYDVRSDALRREPLDLPPSYSTAGLASLDTNIVLESASERRRHRRRRPPVNFEEQDKLPSYHEIIGTDPDGGESRVNDAYEDEGEGKSDREEDAVSLESESRLPPPPPYRPPNLT